MQLTTREEDPSLNQLRTGLLQVPAPVLHHGQIPLLPTDQSQSPLQVKAPLTGDQQQLLPAGLSQSPLQVKVQKPPGHPGNQQKV